MRPSCAPILDSQASFLFHSLPISRGIRRNVIWDDRRHLKPFASDLLSFKNKDLNSIGRNLLLSLRKREKKEGTALNFYCNLYWKSNIFLVRQLSAYVQLTFYPYMIRITSQSFDCCFRWSIKQKPFLNIPMVQGKNVIHVGRVLFYLQLNLISDIIFALI